MTETKHGKTVNIPDTQMEPNIKCGYIFLEFFSNAASYDEVIILGGYLSNSSYQLHFYIILINLHMTNMSSFQETSDEEHSCGSTTKDSCKKFVLLEND